ncbi:kinase-like domain-containing protein [Cantharellus anzutake]|uniref:kinase-like domain-containing protein n=1 Tax=Cantharellus anzutake TaxID=1750568 RepID=UPI0019084A07|nr:kinase-like domain-containing protein [Cantharellus anzutake]KAF8344011.1 kinase-like domain-containing protein [Cantharellus anzutake]
MHHSRGKSSVSSIGSDFTWRSHNRLPTPTPSDTSRNVSPRSSHRRLHHSPSNVSNNSAYISHRDSTSSTTDALASTSSHEISLTAPSSDRTNAFFSASSTTYKLPTPPHRSATLPHRESDRTVTLFRSASDSRPPQSAPHSSGEFFFARVARPPSPPPALQPTSAPPKPKLPPLSRFFPSRHRRNSHDFSLDDKPILTVNPPSTTTSTSSHVADLLPLTDHSLSWPQSPVTNGDDQQPIISHVHTPYKPLHSTLRSKPIPRESLPPDGKDEFLSGTILEVDDLRISLVRLLGKGAFSGVWLARDEYGALTQAHDDLPHERRPSEIGAARRRRDRNVDGLRPTSAMESVQLFSPVDTGDASAETASSHGIPPEGSSLFRGSGATSSTNEAGLVAVKMMEMRVCDANDRMRISFVREVEVLRHISHPNIVSYLHSFTTATHHCLVLEFLEGGELFELLNVDDNYARMTEELLRRLWGELALAVGWMHEVALVHRDIKLENILLTMNPFILDLASPTAVDMLPSPLLKITDFGLSRFIDPASPLLTTRCGSEYYAAPEIILGKPYDGRKTDAWATGIVLYALATRFLPFDRNVPTIYPAPTSGEYHWPGLLPVYDPTLSPPESVPGLHPSSSSATSSSETSSSYASSYSYHRSTTSWIGRSRPITTLCCITRSVDPSVHPPEIRLATEGVRRVVGKLLVREPTKRARIIDLWEDEWMAGPGAPFPPPEAPRAYRHRIMASLGGTVPGTCLEKCDGGDEEMVESMSLRSLGEAASLRRNNSVSGRLVGGDSIPNVARQEAY